MTIVHILLGRADPDTMNGVNKVVHHLASAQTALGHDVEVWGITRTPSARPPADPPYRLRTFPRAAAKFSLSPGLARAMRELSGPWVQLHSVFVPEFARISRLLMDQDVPFGITPHGGYLQRSLKRRSAKKTLYMALVERHVLTRAHLVHAIGATEATELSRWVAPQKIVLVPNGAEPDNEAIATEGTPHGERPIFTYCGRLAAEHKGLDLLVDAFAAYVRRGGMGTLWLVGDGADRSSLERRIAHRGVGDRVRFYGAQFGPAKRSILRASDAFVHTSRWDVTPTACLEAAGLGLPLIITRETNLGDAVAASNAGIVIPDASSAAIAAALDLAEKRWGDTSLATMGANARTMANDTFAWPSIAAQLVQAYESHSRSTSSEA